MPPSNAKSNSIINPPKPPSGPRGCCGPSVQSAPHASGAAKRCDARAGAGAGAGAAAADGCPLPMRRSAQGQPQRAATLLQALSPHLTQASTAALTKQQPWRPVALLPPPIHPSNVPLNLAPRSINPHRQLSSAFPPGSSRTAARSAPPPSPTIPRTGAWTDLEPFGCSSRHEAPVAPPPPPVVSFVDRGPPARLLEIGAAAGAGAGARHAAPAKRTAGQQQVIPSQPFSESKSQSQCQSKRVRPHWPPSSVRAVYPTRRHQCRDLQLLTCALPRPIARPRSRPRCKVVSTRFDGSSETSASPASSNVAIVAVSKAMPDHAVLLASTAAPSHVSRSSPVPVARLVAANSLRLAPPCVHAPSPPPPARSRWLLRSCLALGPHPCAGLVWPGQAGIGPTGAPASSSLAHIAAPRPRRRTALRSPRLGRALAALSCSLGWHYGHDYMDIERHNQRPVATDPTDWQPYCVRPRNHQPSTPKPFALAANTLTPRRLACQLRRRLEPDRPLEAHAAVLGQPIAAAPVQRIREAPDEQRPCLDQRQCGRLQYREYQVSTLAKSLLLRQPYRLPIPPPFCSVRHSPLRTRRREEPADSCEPSAPREPIRRPASTL
ncbi:hypothetical protein ACCO45_007387 [Purpureocillium lilacinum]|uniref:Uncharacterized protein n=1 Tax=Purpureocillium lilacinum TaxID=33203 RepID=A0ACC4DV79_PURLI